MNRDTVFLVPHTHWDREWYEPFQRFRLRLVDLLDDVLPRALADPAFRFTLDGQMAVVDDYLEVRPEAAEDVANLVRRGQFAIGPWAILLDEFLCSGENIVRNLEWGLDRAAAFGGGMSVGYLPDMFGHCAQMPQLLAGAGLEQACVWRGVPSAVRHHAFLWCAPDGTGVRTEYLPGGYGNAAEMLQDPDRLDTAVSAHVQRMRPWYGEAPILAMYGTDHSAPLPWLSSAVSGLGDPDRLRMSTLDEYLARFDPRDVAGLPVWQGELRSHARANILPGVLSSRVHLKRALSGAERMVERYAEPLAALWTEPARWPASLLELAWRRLVQSSCHDSVTGCGVDETAVQVEARIAEAEQIGRGVRDRVLDGLAGRAPADAVVVVNPSPFPRVAVVPVELNAPSTWDSVALRMPDGTEVPVHQTRPDAGEPLYAANRPAAEIALGLRKGSLGLDFLARRVQQVAVSGERELTVTVGRVGEGLRDEHRALAGEVAAAGGVWRLLVVEEPLRTGWAAVPAPSLGWVAARAVPGAGPPVPSTSGTGPPVPSTSSAGLPGVDGRVDADDRRLANEHLTVSVDDNGTLSMRAADGTVLAGVGRIVDGGDVGDLYNYAPPDDDELLDTPQRVEVRLAEAGPLVGRLVVDRRYPWGDARTAVELRRGEAFCRLDVSFENRSPDHRVRLHVPLARPATESYAEGQFAVVRRGLTGEAGHGEEPIPTYPAYGFVDAGGAAVLLDHVTEYELVNGGTELALTLLRATGVISRPDHPLRAEPAGPVIATPLAQCIGPVRASLAVMPHAGDWASQGVLTAAEVFRCPALALNGTAPASTAISAGEGLRVTGEGVVMSSLRRRDAHWLELRLVAMTDARTTARVSQVAAARRADLRGRPGDALCPVDGVLELPMRAWEIATVQLRASG